MAETKAYQIFRGESEWLNVALQLMDVSLKDTNRKLDREYRRGDRSKTIADTLSVLTTDYPRLNHQVGHYQSVIGQTRNKLTEFAINYLYVLWTNYLHSILREMITHNTQTIQLLNNVDRTITIGGIGIEELTDLNNSIHIRRTVIEKVYEYIESISSSRKLMNALITHTVITIPQQIQDDAFCYLDIRNLLIHNHGKLNQKFINKYHSRFPTWSAGGKVERSYHLYCDMFTAISTLCEKIDIELINGGFVSAIH